MGDAPARGRQQLLCGCGDSVWCPEGGVGGPILEGGGQGADASVGGKWVLDGGARGL